MRNLQSLRLLLADKDKEIEELKKELTEEKNAYIKMYNMYVKEKEIKEKAIEYIYRNAFDEDRKDIIDELWVNEINDLLEILKGSDKE